MAAFNLGRFNLSKFNICNGARVDFEMDAHIKFDTSLIMIVLKRLMKYHQTLNPGSVLEIDTDACTVKIDGKIVLDYDADFARFMHGINALLFQTGSPMIMAEYEIEYINKYY